MIAGQLSGVEGYTESIASGMLAGRYAAALAQGKTPTPAPRASANGSLTHYITHAETKKFQPANITFDLLLPLEPELRKKMRDKKERHKLQCDRALEAWDEWLARTSREEVHREGHEQDFNQGWFDRRYCGCRIICRSQVTLAI